MVAARGARSGGDERGYTLVGLMVVVAVLNVLLGVAATSWVTVDRRAREAELIWRGEQIVRAIACYRGREGTAPLERLEQLVEASCLRRVYGDPLSADGQWRVLRRADLNDGTVAAILGIVDAVALDGAEAGGDGRERGLAGDAARVFSLRPDGVRPGAQSPPGAGAGAPAAASGPATAIIGVVTSRPGPALRRYRGEADTGRWAFLVEGPTSGS